MVIANKYISVPFAWTASDVHRPSITGRNEFKSQTAVQGGVKRFRHIDRAHHCERLSCVFAGRAASRDASPSRKQRGWHDGIMPISLPIEAIRQPDYNGHKRTSRNNRTGYYPAA